MTDQTDVLVPIFQVTLPDGSEPLMYFTPDLPEPVAVKGRDRRWFDQPPTGTGYDDGVPSTLSLCDHRAPQTWADVEAHALVEADRALVEHVEGEAERDERRRDGEPEPRRPRRR